MICIQTKAMIFHDFNCLHHIMFFFSQFLLNLSKYYVLLWLYLWLSLAKIMIFIIIIMRFSQREPHVKIKCCWNYGSREYNNLLLLLSYRFQQWFVFKCVKFGSVMYLNYFFFYEIENVFIHKFLWYTIFFFFCK